MLQHADKRLVASQVKGSPVVAGIGVSTTYFSGGKYVYSRMASEEVDRLETLLAAACTRQQTGNGTAARDVHAVTYRSGQAALAALLTRCAPRCVMLDASYHGTKLLTALLSKFAGDAGQGPVRVLSLRQYQALPAAAAERLPLDLIYVEAPSNPLGLLPDLDDYKAIQQLHNRKHSQTDRNGKTRVAGAARRGVVLGVDATLSSPLSFDPLAHGADFAVHSSTKFLGGHSDLLAGVVYCAKAMEAAALRSERALLGNGMGSLETFLLTRSLRTLHLRIPQQARTALQVARFLQGHPSVRTVHHSFLPSHPSHAMAVRYLSLPAACFAFEMEKEEDAQRLPGMLRLFAEATSLGGVESLIDWRRRYSSGLLGLTEPVV